MLAQLSRRVAAAFQSPIVLQLDAEERFQLMSELQSSQADTFDDLPADVRDIVTRAEAEFDVLTAAARDDKRNGAMIALIPSQSDLDRLVLANFEPPEDLHLTLFYLGDAVNITSTQVNELVTNIYQGVHADDLAAPIQAKAFGVAHWNPEGDYPAWVLNVGDEQPAEDGDTPRERVEGLDAVRLLVEQVLTDMRIDYPPQHSPWQPHICVAYSKDDLYGELASRLGPVTFDVLRVAWGEYDIDISLTSQTTAGTATAEFHLPGGHNQKSHGNRKDKPNVSVDAPSTASVPLTKNSSRFNTRAENAAKDADVFEQTPIKSIGSRKLRSLMDDDENINGVPYDDMRSAVNAYANNGYKEINTQLRASEGADVSDEIRAIDAVLDLSHLTDDVVVWRGVNSPSKIFGAAWRDDADMSGLEWTDYGFTSTSAKEESTGVFTRGNDDFVTMRILVPKGVKAMGVGDVDRNVMAHEAEVLLDRGLNYRVVSDTRTVTGKRILDVEVVR